MVDVVVAFAEFWHWPPAVTKGLPISERQAYMEKKVQIEEKRAGQARSSSRGRRGR